MNRCREDNCCFFKYAGEIIIDYRLENARIDLPIKPFDRGLDAYFKGILLVKLNLFAMRLDNQCG